MTCENPWFNNKPNISCIPPGRYDCVPHNGTKYHNVWILKGVPDRTGILIHQGNTIEDTAGCILVGLGLGEIKGLPAVTGSREALLKLHRVLPPEFELLVSGP